MKYLKTSEVDDYCPRVTVPAGKELAYSNVSSRLIDAYLGRSLSIQHYFVDFELNRSITGFVPIRPIVALDPVILTTGLQIRPMEKTIAGGRELIGLWQDVSIPADVDSLVNFRTGRMEVFANDITDYSRMFANTHGRRAVAWLAQMEIRAGHLVDTTLSATAANGATTVTLSSVVGIEANSTKLNFGDNVAEYTATAIVGSVVTISPALVAASTLPIGTAVTEVVPEDVKIACGQVIEDRLTYEPNTIKQLSTLDVISERFDRADTSPIPVDAQRILAKYRN